MKRQIKSNDACYTAPLAPMSAAFSRRLCFIAAILLCAVLSEAQDVPTRFTPQATRLVTEIMNRSGSPGFVTLEVQNLSQLSAADVTIARRAIETQLRAAGARLVRPDRAIAEITVTISENPQGVLWVAEIKQGLTTQTIMLQGAPAVALAPPQLPLLTLKRIPIYADSGDVPMLDFVVTDPKTLYVLHANKIAAYRWDGARWSLLNDLSFERSTPAPRDIRGRLTWQSSQLTAYLPGMQCAAPLGADGTLKGIQCENIDDPWPLDNSFTAFFSPNRNFFSGILRGANFNSAVKSIEASLPPFYSASAIGEANASWVFTGTDGRARLYSSLTQAPHVYSGWGSDITSIHSTCGSQWQLLVSKPSDRSQTDAIQAMEIASGEPVPVSTTLEIPGAITAMWRSPDGTGANVISRDPATGKYEASTINIDCR